MPNLGSIPTHHYYYGDLSASDACCKSKNEESLGDNFLTFSAHIFVMLFNNPCHPSPFTTVFCHNFLGRHRLQFSAMQLRGEADCAKLQTKGKYKTLVGRTQLLCNN